MASGTFAWPRFESAQDRQAAEAAVRADAEARGYADGLARAEAELAAARDALARGLADLTRQVEVLGESQAEAVTELALHVTRQLLIAELRTNPAVLQDLVGEALDSLKASLEHVQVLVNPADRDALVESFERLDGDKPEIVLEADSSVPTGGLSVVLGARSVEFDPLGRLEAFVEQELSDGAHRQSSGSADPAL